MPVDGLARFEALPNSLYEHGAEGTLYNEEDTLNFFESLEKPVIT